MSSVASSKRSLVAPDYYARGLALWSRLGHPRPSRLRHDPHRVAALICGRTLLPYPAIRELLGAPTDPGQQSNSNH
jgi:hypothetical protein